MTNVWFVYKDLKYIYDESIEEDYDTYHVTMSRKRSCALPLTRLRMRRTRVVHAVAHTSTAQNTSARRHLVAWFDSIFKIFRWWMQKSYLARAMHSCDKCHNSHFFNCARPRKPQSLLTQLSPEIRNVDYHRAIAIWHSCVQSVKTTRSRRTISSV